MDHWISIVPSWSVCKLHNKSNSPKYLILIHFPHTIPRRADITMWHKSDDAGVCVHECVCNREVLCSVCCVLTHRPDRVFSLGLDSYRIRRSKLSTGKKWFGVGPEQHMPHKNREWIDKRLNGSRKRNITRVYYKIMLGMCLSVLVLYAMTQKHWWEYFLFHQNRQNIM